MSDHVASWVWRQEVGGPAAKLILVKLASMANDDGSVTMPVSQTKLARELEMRRETMNRHLTALRGLGILQVTGGERGEALTYRVVVPWFEEDVRKTRTVGKAHIPAAETHTAAAKAHSASPLTPASPSPEPPSSPPPLSPTTSNLAADAAAAEHVGPDLWRVPSPRRDTGFIVDLAAGTCECENRSGSECRHIREAREAAQRADAARRREIRDSLWDVLIGLFGEPTSNQRAMRGSAVTELAEALTTEKVPVEQWPDEIQSRVAALRKEWGLGKVTLPAFVRNVQLAGQLVHNVREGGKNGERVTGYTNQQAFE